MTIRNIFLTGASRGIGAVVALELARRGHRVGCVSRRGTGPEGVKIPEELKTKLVPLKGDVGDPAAIAAALDAFAQTAGPIDGIVNNAGVHVIAPAESQPLSEFEEVLATNTTATALNAPALADGAVTSTTVAPSAGSKVVNLDAKWTYAYLNGAVVAPGTYGGVNANNSRVTYTASMP